jgi:hypothetical protein
VIEERSSRGRQALREYLEYAQHGPAERTDVPAREVESDCEALVLEALRAGGYEAELRVGAAGQRIDLAVRHPQEKGVIVLGVECDGPSYAFSRSARDRDRLRQQVLENLGWQLHRIWSPDWYADPAREAASLLAAVEQAAKRFDRALKKAG